MPPTVRGRRARTLRRRHAARRHTLSATRAGASAKAQGTPALLEDGPAAAPAQPGGAGEDRAGRSGARARAIRRGLRATREILAASGGTHDLPHVQALLNGISHQAVEEHVREGRLLAIPGSGPHRAFPAVQFMDDGSVVPGLPAVREALGASGPWSVLLFLVAPHGDLGARRPIDLMKAGDLALVLEAARRMDIQGS